MPATSNPTAGDVHVNTPLTNFSQKYLQQESAFVAMSAFPNIPVLKQSDLYYVFDRADFNRDEATLRGDGAESAGGQFRLSTSPYYANVIAFHKDVTDRQRSNADNPVSLDETAAQYVTQKLMIKRERDFAATFFVPNVWFNGGSSASAGQDVNWVLAASDPVFDVRAAIRGVHGKTGFRPNRMLIGRQSYDTLLENDSVLARISGGATAATPAIVMRQLLAQLFELESINVMDSVVNTGVAGDGSALNQNETSAFIGGDSALLYYAPSSAGLNTPTAGVQFSWTGLLGATSAGMRIKRFRMEHLESERIEGEMSYDFKVVAPELGHLFITTSA